MLALTNPMKQLEDVRFIQADMKAGRLPVLADGCIDAGKGHFVHMLSEDYPYKVIVTGNDVRAKEFYEDYKFYDRNTMLYPAKDVIFYSADIHGNYIVRQRLLVLRRLLEKQPVTVITTIDGLMDSVLDLEFIRKNTVTLEAGEICDLEKLKKKLVNIGFERVGQVEEPGQFAVRGGILDVYNMSDDCPYRIEFFDDEIDSIRSFDAESQRSIENCDTFMIYPASEFVLTDDAVRDGLRRIKAEAKKTIKTFEENKNIEAAGRLAQTIRELEENLREGSAYINIDAYIHYFYPNTMSFIDYFDNKDSIIFLDEPNRLEEKGEAVAYEFREGMTGRLEKGYILPGQMQLLHDLKVIWHKLSKLRTIVMATLAQKFKMLDIKSTYSFTMKSISSFNGNFEMLVKALDVWKKNKYKIILVSGSETRAQRLAKDLQSFELNAFYTADKDRIVNEGEIMVIHGGLHRGFEYPLIKFAVIAETDIFGEEKKKKPRKKRYDGQKIQSFADLSIGDYVVHENHGLGVYKGIEKIEVDKVEKDYIKIEYAGGGNLYVLATQLDLIQKYAGADARKPKLNKLGGQEWHKTKTRVRGAVKDLAADLIKLYAARQAEQGYAYSPDTVWQREFEEMFPYTETDDQLMAIEAAKKDMESTKIMDRLVCGDVGYGKTEVAIRIAFKAVQDGKQVVVLVPTTILAQQHYNTFVQRMKDYPVTVGMLSRFRTPKQQSETLKGLKNGMVDIVIGTHRVLSKDVEFKDLGLLIVDEEQRFGVAHKEKIKQFRKNVDVLTLTATPIPRTLHMSLIGIRDMCVLEEPPMDRMPIQTYVLEYNEEMIREAILRELGRNGQVYYVFNRVNGIAEMASKIAEFVPDASVAFAHGQMSERELEKIMYQFINGEIDVLVSTTIIETGLDISNVNTMIIHDADKMGLSQLYQLRGRVGRSNRLAYAFLMYRRNTVLREIAEKRLAAIREFTDLGSGFKIAMRDLEIRGAGNLLGEQQSGHMEAVGYDLYCKMLNEAVRQLKGETVEETFETSVELDIDAYIPASYIKNEFQKLDVYKRIAAISNEEDYDEMMDELIDRYGELPRPAQNLLMIALLKAQAHEAGITQLVQRGESTKIMMYNRANVDINRIPPLLEKYGRVLKFVGGENPYFIYKHGNLGSMDILKCEKTVIKDIKALLD